MKSKEKRGKKSGKYKCRRMVEMLATSDRDFCEKLFSQRSKRFTFDIPRKGRARERCEALLKRFKLEEFFAMLAI